MVEDDFCVHLVTLVPVVTCIMIAIHLLSLTCSSFFLLLHEFIFVLFKIIITLSVNAVDMFLNLSEPTKFVLAILFS